jgi:hypothetical protein
MLEAKEIGARIGIPIDQQPEDRHKMTLKLGAFKTSMLQDVEAGRAVWSWMRIGERVVKELGAADRGGYAEHGCAAGLGAGSCAGAGVVLRLDGLVRGLLGAVGDQAGGVRFALRVPRASRPSS